MTKAFEKKMRFEGTYHCVQDGDDSPSVVADRAKNRLKNFVNTNYPGGSLHYSESGEIASGGPIDLNVEIRVPVVVDEDAIDPALTEEDKEDERDKQRSAEWRKLSRRMRDERESLPPRKKFKLVTIMNEYDAPEPEAIPE